MKTIIIKNVYANVANVDLSTVKANIGIYDDDSEDNIIESYINTAYDIASQYLSYPINPVVKQVSTRNTNHIRIPKSKYTTIRDIDIKYYNKDNEVTEFTEFTVDDSNPESTVVKFAILDVDNTNDLPLAITYTEQMLKGSIPVVLSQCIISIVVQLYETKGVVELNNGSYRLLDSISENYGN